MPITTNYSVAYVFTKHTDLLQWFDVNYSTAIQEGYLETSLGFNQLRQSYAKPREVQLILLARFDGNKHYCKIKCPINPLPVKGEFEAPSLGCVQRWLVNNGWSFERKLPISFLK